jgi:hypothetical protein
MAMWESLSAGREFDAAWAVLIEEACRIADRLEKLDLLLRGDVDTWARIEDDYTGGGSHKEIVLVFDDALAEARQQANALRQIVTSLKLGQASEKSTGKRSALDDLAAKRAGRRSAPAS